MSVILLSILSMLSAFMQYVRNDYQPLDSQYAVFQGEHTGAADERGVRTNADLSMVAAFMGEDTMALKTLSFAVHTHKAVRKRRCPDGRYWGSVSAKDHQWESSLWAMSVAYSAYFQWQRLPDSLKTDIYHLLKAECNYELERDIPTGYVGDTKAEENGWEVDVLAATLGLFPDDPLAPQWFQRMRAFAINSYSHPSDAPDTTVIDPDYDETRVCDLYKGPNLYPDWTLQNHDFFHTSYQNVVIQELGEAALALQLFQGRRQRWASRALLHNCDKVTKNVLNWLTLPDGEQAMPNGNDWSLFLYDQVTSYATMACMLRDPDALYFEQQCLKCIAQRQQSTTDASFLLRPDVGARRMGVQAHRLMMTELMHRCWPTDGMTPTRWTDFERRYHGSKIFPCQQIVRTLTPHYFACFSFSKGKKSYTGYLAPIHDGHTDNLVIPFRQYNTGNIIGYYQPKTGSPNAKLVGEPTIDINGDYFTVRATLAENDSTIIRRFTLRSRADGLEYSDVVKTKSTDALKDYTGLIAISTDEFTGRNHQVDFQPGYTRIDNQLTIKADCRAKAQWAKETIDNSIRSRRLAPYLAEQPKKRHHIIYSVNRRLGQSKIGD